MKQKQNQKTSTFSLKNFSLHKQTKSNRHSLFNKILASLIFVVMIAYVVSINDLSIKGFVLQDLKKNIKQLEIENEHYELSAMSLESYDKINTKAIAMGLVKVDDIEYVTVNEEGAVAVR